MRAARNYDGLLTATNLHTGTADRVVRTPAAAEFDVHEEAAFIPVIRLTSTVNNLSAATAGRFDIEIPFVKRAA